jgi:hypothetical protein
MRWHAAGLAKIVSNGANHSIMERRIVVRARKVGKQGKLKNYWTFLREPVHTKNIN